MTFNYACCGLTLLPVSLRRWMVGLNLLLVAAVGFAMPAMGQQRTVKQLLSSGFEIKGVVSGAWLILQKGNHAFFCGSADSSLTWSNWPSVMKDAKCEPLHE